MRKIHPRGEQVLLDPLPTTPRGARVTGEPGRIIVPDSAQEPSRIGKVLAAGPGKWVPGQWWPIGEDDFCPEHGDPIDCGCKWQWIPGHRDPMDVQPGDTVLFPRYAGVEFVRGEDHPDFVGLRLMKESEIILKIERN